MNQGIISRRYASALWMYAQKNGQEDRVYVEVKRLCRGFSKYEALKRVLSNRMVPQEDKIEVITLVAGENVSHVFSNFIRLLFANKREKFLRIICLSFETIYLKENKILSANLVTAVPVDKDMERRFIQSLEKRTGYSIWLTTQVNPKIAGGYVIMVDTYRLDASVVTKLKRIEKSLLETAINF